MRTTRTSGSPGPGGSERAPESFVHAEDFARAVDAGTGRTSDPTRNHELALVAALRQAGAAVTGPDTFERDRMRRRIMAEFPTVAWDAAHSSAAHGPARRRRGAAHRAPARWSAIPDEARGRLLVAAAAALCLFMSLSAMSLLLSRDALPGDALYTFKRSAESAELGLTFGDERKAFKHLEFANARVSEIEALADQADAAGTWSASEGKFLQALQDFERDTTAGARLLAAVAADGQSGILAPLSGWAEQQETRLQAVSGALPPLTSTRLDSTFELLDRVTARMVALNERSTCRTISSGSHDDLGLLPAREDCQSPSSTESPSTSLLPQDDVIASADPVDGPVPGLLAPTSGVVPVPEPRQSDEFELPSSPGDVLKPPGEPDGEFDRRPSLPENGSPPPPILPLQIPWLPQFPPPEFEDPHVE
ncbi:MAG: DUF5667 domain-containing protein [Pseudonocardiaceae bacterium]